MNVVGTKTEKNLLSAFAGESMAIMRYTIYGQKAKKDGYEQIKAYFDETTKNEQEHAKRIFRFLGGEGATLDNLQAAAYGEHEEWADIYKESAQVAQEEGFMEIATFFTLLSEAEKEHETRFLALLNLLETNRMFEETQETIWICRNCGHVHVGKEAPEPCPLCLHPQAYFQRKNANY